MSPLEGVCASHSATILPSPCCSLHLFHSLMFPGCPQEEIHYWSQPYNKAVLLHLNEHESNFDSLQLKQPWWELCSKAPLDRVPSPSFYLHANRIPISLSRSCGYPLILWEGGPSFSSSGGRLMLLDSDLLAKKTFCDCSFPFLPPLKKSDTWYPGSHPGVMRFHA